MGFIALGMLKRGSFSLGSCKDYIGIIEGVCRGHIGLIWRLL